MALQCAAAIVNHHSKDARAYVCVRARALLHAAYNLRGALAHHLRAWLEPEHEACMHSIPRHARRLRCCGVTYERVVICVSNRNLAAATIMRHPCGVVRVAGWCLVRVGCCTRWASPACLSAMSTGRSTTPSPTQSALPSSQRKPKSPTNSSRYYTTSFKINK